MNPEKQRIAIAEACGWKSITSFGKNITGVLNQNSNSIRAHIPNYLNDLNAMHKAEKELYARPNKSDGTVWAYVYESHLINITTTEIIATAAQRAEAFLKTIGKWEGEQP